MLYSQGHLQNMAVVALDRMNLDKAKGLVFQVRDRVYAFKVHSLYDAGGPSVVSGLKESGASRIWVDLKLHDTPDTVADRAAAIRDAGADILTVHASGEVKMMEAAVKNGPPEVYAITALTSLSEEQAHLIFGQPSKAAVLYLARLAKLAGVAGIVCSPHEVGVLAKQPELAGLTFVNPGIRLAGQKGGQQERFDTPEFAIKQGAHRLVLGSVVTKAEDPSAALDLVEQEIEQALAAKAA